MDTIITKQAVATAVYEAIPQLACELPADILAGLQAALEREEAPRGRAVLQQLVENAHIAKTDHVPICQDTGTVWVSLEVGPGVLVPADVFANVNNAVARAYDEARLRKSVVRDAILDRTNTGDNTPAFCDIHPVDEPGVARLRIMLKGGGSDNASRVVMLPPGAGRAGIVEEVVKCVREKGANACPPLVTGIGIGGTFDKVAGLAKRALMRPLDEPAETEDVRELEEELLEAINATGVGPGGIGGATAALGVRVATAPCHIAALPLAINMGCSAMRRATVDLAVQPAGASAEPVGDSATRRSAAQDPSDPSCAALLQSCDDINGVQTVAPPSTAADPAGESGLDDQEGASAYRIEVVKNTATPESTAQDTSVLLLDPESAFRALLDDKAAGVPAPFIARRFHDAFVQAIADAAELCRALYGIGTVALSGGVFMNRYLVEHALQTLERAGFTVAVNRDLPPNDGCVSYGQAVVAWAANNDNA